MPELKTLRFHDLRRHGISLLFEMGYSYEDVKRVSGHKDMRVLMEVYAQYDRTEDMHAKYDAEKARKAALGGDRRF